MLVIWCIIISSVRWIADSLGNYEKDAGSGGFCDYKRGPCLYQLAFVLSKIGKKYSLQAINSCPSKASDKWKCVFQCVWKYNISNCDWNINLMDIFLPELDEKVMKQNIWVSLTTDRQVFEKHDLEKLQTRRPGIKEHIPSWILWVSIRVNFFTQNFVAPLPPVMQFWKWWNLDTYETPKWLALVFLSAFL